MKDSFRPYVLVFLLVFASGTLGTGLGLALLQARQQPMAVKRWLAWSYQDDGTPTLVKLEQSTDQVHWQDVKDLPVTVTSNAVIVANFPTYYRVGLYASKAIVITN